MFQNQIETMKNLFILFLILLCKPSIFCQKIINVDASLDIGVVKDIFGGNKGGEQVEQSDFLHKIGIKDIRIHDYHPEGGDYFYYTDFWNKNDDGTAIDINNDFDPSNTDHYRWTETDQLVKSILDNDFEIYFRIGTSYPNPDYILQAQVPPVDETGMMDFTKFAQLATNTVRHYNAGWNNGFEYDIKYWEIWNEPGGLFWNGTPIQFYKMYQAVSDSIKNSFPEIKVGALGAVPATTLGANKAYKEDFIEYCNVNDVNLDFYSWHIYGLKNPYALKQLGIEARRLLDDNGFPDAESHITEINDELTIEIEDLINSSKGAAYFLSLMLTAQESEIDKMLIYPSQSLIKSTFTSTEFEMTKSALAMEAFEYFRVTTPIQLSSSGNELVTDIDDESLNLMMYAGINNEDDKIGLLISNLNSEHNEFIINIANLPWSETHPSRLTKTTITKNTADIESVEVIPQGVSMFVVENLVSPAVTYLQVSPALASDIKDTEAKPGLKIAPNPTAGVLNLMTDSIIESIDIYNIQGRKMLSQKKNSRRIDIGDLTSGQYIAYIKLKNSNSIVKKFIVK